MIENVSDLIKYNIKEVVGNYYEYDDGVVSVYDLIQAGKYRWEIQKNYFDQLKEASLFSEFIKDVYIHGNNNGDEFIIELVPNNNNGFHSINGKYNILLKYDSKNNGILFSNSMYFNTKNKDIINTLFLSSNEIMQTILWSITNNFNREYSLRSSFDDDFVIDFRNRFLSVSLPGAFNSSKKNFTICYKYDQKYNEDDFVIKTGDGNFKIETNIIGLQDYLTTHRYDSCSLPNGGAIYYINDFVRNLMIESNNLPEPLKIETSKIKILKK